jgi:broad specificity phosphatase PhoE
MSCFLIRHGQIDSNLKKIYSGRSEEALNSKGIAQAQKAVEVISELGIDKVCCSPLRRTQQTATIIANQLGLTAQSDNAFIEMAFGPWEGMSEMDIAKDFPDEWAIWNETPHLLRLPGRETLSELQQRVLDGAQSIKSAEPSSNILIVSHVAVIRTLLLYSEGRPLSEYKGIHVDNCVAFPIVLGETA